MRQSARVGVQEQFMSLTKRLQVELKIRDLVRSSDVVVTGVPDESYK